MVSTLVNYINYLKFYMTLVRKYNIKYIFYWIVHKNYLFIIYKLLCSNFSIYVNELYIYIYIQILHHYEK